MSLSINSVIHFTNRIENLKSILSCNGFRIKYCAEELGINDRNTTVGAFPMVCFCDIPLSEIKNHIDSYGSYGIGLTKNWAKQTGLNPVLYIERNSRLANFLNMQSNRLLEFHQEGKPDTASMFEYFKFLSYCKNYEGRLKRGEKNEANYRFYNEREWRIVALPEEINNQLTFM
jgi:hypothetical protein